MAVTEVLQADAVALDGTLFELAAKPGVQNVTPFPEKLTFGDFSRETDPLASVWVLSDWTGGFLKRRLKADTDIDRFWDSTAETRYTTELRLPPLATSLKSWTGYPQSATMPASGTNQVYATSAVEYVDTRTTARPTRLLVAFFDPTSGGGATFRYLDVTAEAWVTPGVVNANFATDTGFTLSGWNNPFDCAIHAFMDAQIWYVFGSETGIGFYSPDPVHGATWTFQAGSGTGNPCPKADRLVYWDEKLFGLDSGSGGFWMCTSISGHIASPSAWDRRAYLPVRAYDCRHLKVFRNQSGEPVPHAICKDSVWAYDYAADTWIGPIVEYERVTDSADGCVFRRGTLYIGNDTAVLAYDTNTLRDIGLDRDWGLPAYRRGPVYRLADAHSWVAAGLDSSNTSTPTPQAGVYLWNEVGWHHLWLSDYAGTNITMLQRAQADARARLYWGVHGTLDNDVYYVDMPPGIFNPHDVTTTEYAASAEVITGWNPLNWEEQGKCAFAMPYRAEGCSDTETIALYYALDDDESDDAWVHVGTIAESGAGSFALGDQGFGVAFRTMRLKIVLSRGSTTTATPVLRFLGVKFARRPAPIYAYTLTLAIKPDGYNNLTAHEQEQALMALLEKDTMLQLAFRQQGTPLGHVPDQGVFITHFSSPKVLTGLEAGGLWQVSLVEFAA